MAPYVGTPLAPAKYMEEYRLIKDNTIRYYGSYYSVPLGTYRAKGATVWTNEYEGMLEIYDRKTGKQIACHGLSPARWKYICDPSYRTRVYQSRKDL